MKAIRTSTTISNQINSPREFSQLCATIWRDENVMWHIKSFIGIEFIVNDHNIRFSIAVFPWISYSRLLYWFDLKPNNPTERVFVSPTILMRCVNSIEHDIFPSKLTAKNGYEDEIAKCIHCIGRKISNKREKYRKLLGN